MAVVGEESFGDRARVYHWEVYAPIAAVVAEVLEAIEPAGIEAALKASEQVALEDQEKRRAVELALERARYEAKRARATV